MPSANTAIGAPHSYLVLGEERATLIESGLGVGNIKAVVERLTSTGLRS